MNEWMSEWWFCNGQYGISREGEGWWRDVRRKEKREMTGIFRLFVCSPWLSGIKLSLHFIKSLLSIQYVLGTLLDASNTKMKIKTKQKQNHSPLTPFKADLAWAWEAGPSGMQNRGLEYNLPSSHLNLHPCLSRLTSMYPSPSPASSTCLSNFPLHALSPSRWGTWGSEGSSSG